MATLKGYLAAADEGKIHISEKVKAFWRAKLASHEELLKVLEPTGDAELKKQYLEKANQVWRVGLKEVLEKVNKELVGPYALGSSSLIASVLSLLSRTIIIVLFGMSAIPSIVTFPSFLSLAEPSEIDTEPNLAKPLVAFVSFDESMAHSRIRFR